MQPHASSAFQAPLQPLSERTSVRAVMLVSSRETLGAQHANHAHQDICACEAPVHRSPVQRVRMLIKRRCKPWAICKALMTTAKNVQSGRSALLAAIRPRLVLRVRSMR